MLSSFSYSKIAPILTLALVFVASSCKMDSYTSESSLSSCYCEQYEDYGTAYYEHLKYNQALADPKVFLPDDQRQVFQQKLDSLLLLATTNDWDLQDFLQHFVSAQMISSDLASNFKDLDVIIRKLFTGQETFLQTISDIQTLTDTSVLNNTISCGDKSIIVATNSVYKKMLYYFNEVGVFSSSEMSYRDCETVWQNLVCLWQIEQSMVLRGAAGAVAGLIVGVFFPPALPAFVTAGIIAGVTSGLFLNADCCDNASLDCQPVLGVSLQFTDCSPTAMYKAFGFGASVFELTWTNTGATPSSATMTAPIDPRLTITQTSTSTPVVTTIVSSCGGILNPQNFLNSFERDLSALSKQVLGLALLGPTAVPPSEMLEPITYMVGGFLTSRYEIVSWEAWHGTVVDSDDGTAQILWDSGETQGEVRVKVKNICTNGETKSFLLRVDLTSGWQ